MVKEVWGTNALVEWQPPKDDGNSEVTGYFVQKADKKTMVRGQRGLGGWGKVEQSFLFHSWETEAWRQWEWAGSRRQTAASAPPLLRLYSHVARMLAFPGPSLSPFQEWFNVYEHNRHTSCTVSDLIVGNEYYFRIFSENICGLSDSPGVSKNTARILKTGAGLPGTELQLLAVGPWLGLGWDSRYGHLIFPRNHLKTTGIQGA